MGNLKRPELAAIKNKQFDLVVVGGGITGAGIAQDAASRGLKVLLVEKGDFASGTSSKSTKLIHGGLRYLANMQFSVTAESLRERELLRRIAPHMVWQVPFIIPTYKGQFLNTLKLRAGLCLYDLLAGAKTEFRHKSISAAEVVRQCQGVRRKGLTGGLLYWDCRTDDARHTLEVLKSASQFGAVVANYMRVDSAVTGADGKICGVQLTCLLTGQQANVNADVVVNAAGVWAQKVSHAANTAFAGQIVPSKGIHITVSRKRLPVDAAMIVPSVHDKRFLFAVPWYGAVVLGTTDTEYKGSLESVGVEPHEVSYVLDAVNALFPNARLTEADITGRYAGLRPLIKQAGKGSTADLSRQHLLDVSPQGLVTISGGKFTTYRPMAAEAVDLVCRLRGGETPPCRTDEIMLGGFDDDVGYKSMEGMNRAERVQWLTVGCWQRARALGLSEETARYLTSVYGRQSVELLKLLKQRPELAEPLAQGHPYIMAQVVWAVRAESARTVSDVLMRRVRLGLVDARAAMACAERVYAVLANELGAEAGDQDQKILELALEAGVRVPS